MPRTKRRTAGCAIIALLVQTIILPYASAQDFAVAPDKQPRFMLYVSKGFGDSSEIKTAPQLGLRLENDFSLGHSQYGHIRPIVLNKPLLDLRWTKGYGQSFRVLDAPVYLSPRQLNSTEGSSHEGGSTLDSLAHGWGLAAAIGVGTLALLCATNTIICEDDDEEYVIPDESGPASPGE